jgi:hypothetical protein
MGGRDRLAALFFDDVGKVVRREELLPGGPVHGFEIPPGTWHTIVALESGSISSGAVAGDR